MVVTRLDVSVHPSAVEGGDGDKDEGAVVKAGKLLPEEIRKNVKLYFYPTHLFLYLYVLITYSNSFSINVLYHPQSFSIISFSQLVAHIQDSTSACHDVSAL